jgi:two-component system, sensor histidine kinase and response regulator
MAAKDATNTKSGAAAPSEGAEPGVAAGSVKILVVDDNAQNRALAEATLDDAGYVACLASSGEEALRHFEAEIPDCVLLDVRMPGMDGFQTCARIRQLPGGAETPIVFLTAQRDVETFDAALRAGGDDFLTKPVRPTELIVRVQSALRVKRLSAELREHYDLVKQQRDDLMRLQLQKERLTSFLVHDLKNPVGTMDLRAQQALRDPQLPEKPRQALLQIRDEAKALSRLILNLLDISKSEERGLTPKCEPVDAQVLVREVLNELELRAATNDVTLRSRLEPFTLQVDVDLLRRVIANLVENAIRYAPAKSEVTVTGRILNRDIELRVVDRGPGVPLELRERIFEPFAQLDNQQRLLTRSGRGLGLTFCRLAVQAHGGQLSVEDANPGASFLVALPEGAVGN